MLYGFVIISLSIISDRKKEINFDAFVWLKGLGLLLNTLSVGTTDYYLSLTYMKQILSVYGPGHIKKI